MLGKPHRPELQAKAAETIGLLPFAVELLERYANQFPGNQGHMLLASGKSALAVNDVIRTSDRVIPSAEQQSMMSWFLRHMSLYAKAGGIVTPKFHYMVHCLQRISRRGNPRFYHTYRDESMNGVIARIAKCSHRLSFALVVLKKYKLLHILQPTGVGMF